MNKLLVAVVLLFAFEQAASAYADPGSGALLWQILVAGFVGFLFHVRGFLARVRGSPRDTKL
ncbi:MAG TPA: hypothetical protein VLH09_06365 [Bryobacteraceae bacterium]|nr:hypothetical protein [Bryobacteraceae bacterium]